MMLDLQKISHGNLRQRLPVRSSRVYSYAFDAGQQIPKTDTRVPASTSGFAGNSYRQGFRLGTVTGGRGRFRIGIVLGCVFLFIVLFFAGFYGRNNIPSVNPLYGEASSPHLKETHLKPGTHQGFAIKAPCLLTIFAAEDAWLRVSISNEILFEGILVRGMKEEWKVAAAATIRMASPQSFKFCVDGKEVPVSFWGTTKPASLSISQTGYSLLPLARADK